MVAFAHKIGCFRLAANSSYVGAFPRAFDRCRMRCRPIPPFQRLDTPVAQHRADKQAGWAPIRPQQAEDRRNREEYKDDSADQRGLNTENHGSPFCGAKPKRDADGTCVRRSVTPMEAGIPAPLHRYLNSIVIPSSLTGHAGRFFRTQDRCDSTICFLASG